MWDGSVQFGDSWVAYQGGTDQHRSHAHAAAQLAFAVDGQLSIDFAGSTVDGTAFYVAPGVQHIARASTARVLFLYLSPQSDLSRALQQRFGEAGVAPLDALLPQGVTDARSLIAALSQRLSIAPAPGDVRLDLAIHFLERQPEQPAGIIARAAHAAGLSESRLRVLAKQRLGVPLSQWLLWRKLEAAATAIADGLPLAVAAADGGFADQAHLSRTMRRMFGITPTDAVDPLQAHKRFVQDG